MYNNTTASNGTGIDLSKLAPEQQEFWVQLIKAVQSNACSLYA